MKEINDCSFVRSLSISQLIMYEQYSSYYIISSACLLFIQSMLLVHVAPAYTMAVDCLTSAY